MQQIDKDLFTPEYQNLINYFKQRNKMNKIQTFEPGTYVTNENMSGIVNGYSQYMFCIDDDMESTGKFLHLSIGCGHVNKDDVYFDMSDYNDGSFREMNDSEIHEFNQILLKNGYIWDADSKKVIKLEATVSRDIKEDKKESKQKFKTGDFLTSIDGQETFIFMRYVHEKREEWMLGWTMRFNNEEKRYMCEVLKFNPGHPWEDSTKYDKEIFLRRLKDTCYVWYGDVKEMRKEYELEDYKLKCGDIIHFRDGETVIFKEISDDKLNMRVWHAPADDKILVEYKRFTPWRYATGNEQDYILDIMAANGYVWDKDKNNFFSNPRMIKTNIGDNVIQIPQEIQPINIPEGYRAEIKDEKIYFFKEFKDGEFIKTKNGDAIAIFKEISDRGEIIGYVEYFRSSNEFLTAEDILGLHLDQWTYATDEDIKLFKEKLAEQNYKWDENKKELVNLFWTPKIGETYFFINRKFNVIDARNINNEVHQHRISLHNCFKTEEDATELLKEMKQMLVNYNKQKYGK